MRRWQPRGLHLHERGEPTDGGIVPRPVDPCRHSLVGCRRVPDSKLCAAPGRPTGRCHGPCHFDAGRRRRTAIQRQQSSGTLLPPNRIESGFTTAMPVDSCASVSIRGLNDIFSEIFAHLAPLIPRGHGWTRMGIRSDGSRDVHRLPGAKCVSRKISEINSPIDIRGESALNIFRTSADKALCAPSATEREQPDLLSDAINSRLGEGGSNIDRTTAGTFPGKLKRSPEPCVNRKSPQ